MPLTHFRGILFQTAPILFGDAEQTQRDTLVKEVIDASKDTHSNDPAKAATANAKLPVAVQNLANFNNEFTGDLARQAATRTRVTDWIAGVKAALTDIVKKGGGSSTVFLASIPEFGLNAYTGSANAANVIPDTLEAYIVEQLSTMLKADFKAYNVLFMISCCTYKCTNVATLDAQTSYRDGSPGRSWRRLPGLSQITVISSSPGVDNKCIPKKRRVDADKWENDNFAHSYVSPPSDVRQAQLRFEILPGGPTLGFTTCADAEQEGNTDVNLCMYFGDTFPLQGMMDTTHSFLLNDAEGWKSDPMVPALFQPGFYRMGNKSPPTAGIALKSMIEKKYTTGAQKTLMDQLRQKYWETCWYIPTVLRPSQFFPLPSGPVICRATEPIEFPPRT